jgi:CheY-like chemotaxis protein
VHPIYETKRQTLTMPDQGRDRIVVVSRDPKLADVRKSILERAGFAVIAATDDVGIEEACKSGSVRLIMLGYSLAPADKRRVWAAVKAHCNIPILELHHRADPELVERNVFAHASEQPDDFIDSVRKILKKPASGQNPPVQNAQ